MEQHQNEKWMIYLIQLLLHSIRMEMMKRFRRMMKMCKHGISKEIFVIVHHAHAVPSSGNTDTWHSICHRPMRLTAVRDHVYIHVRQNIVFIGCATYISTCCWQWTSIQFVYIRRQKLTGIENASNYKGKTCAITEKCEIHSEYLHLGPCGPWQNDVGRFVGCQQR